MASHANGSAGTGCRSPACTSLGAINRDLVNRSESASTAVASRSIRRGSTRSRGGETDE